MEYQIISLIRASSDAYVVNENIEMPPEWINFFVLADWDLQQEKLKVHFEKKNSISKDIVNKLPNELKFIKKFFETGACLFCHQPLDTTDKKISIFHFILLNKTNRKYDPKLDNDSNF